MKTPAGAKKKTAARLLDAAATKATILDCAVREFAERGYDGAHGAHRRCRRAPRARSA